MHYKQQMQFFVSIDTTKKVLRLAQEMKDQNQDGFTNSTLKWTHQKKKIKRRDLCSSHEVADIIITKHAISSSVLGRSVQVVCDDTDVFILLVHFYHTHGPERAVIDIKQTSEVHKDIAPDLLVLHGLSEADKVSSIHGIGKSTVVKIAKKGKLNLGEIGNINADMNEVIDQATKFICSAYGKNVSNCSSMAQCRI